MKILFITSTRVGDAILSSGLLAHLIGEHPGARVTIACGPAAAPLFRAVPGLERIIVLDKMLFSLHWMAMWVGVVASFWDIVVDLRNTPMSYPLAAKKRFRITRKKPPGHRVEQLAAVMELGDQPPAPRVWISDAARDRAKILIPAGPPVLAIGPTANWSAKTWRPEYFVDLIGRLTGPGGILPGARIAVFGRDDERPLALRLIDSIPEDRRIDLVGQLELMDVSACLERAQFYIGNDSGLMHLAAAVGIPTLGLFGPSLEELYAPWGPLGVAVRADKSFDEIFPENFDHRDTDSLMDSLTVDTVEAAARDLWRQAAEDAA
ncbi:MAG: glycosyltransferase family 9 protein [Rhodospirillales bacterium]|nr:glycosyltransferase family 9 protein [Alphaproteobacteria bacterium]MBL6947247.1 glycosyltransferase family 9 protein [Rhodospirillales bacterium]